MSINFENEMNPEAAELMRKHFGEAIAMDKKTALFERMGVVHQQQLKEIANTAKQLVSLEIHQIGDRKEVGGVVYELDEKGWRRLPIGTRL